MAVVSTKGRFYDGYAQAFRFQVEFVNWHPLAVIPFSRVSGISASTDVIEYREGDDPLFNLKFAGLVSFDNITFERGIVKDRLEARRFFAEVINVIDKGILAFNTTGDGVNAVSRTVEIRTDIVIKVLSRNKGNKIRSYRVFNAIPVNLSIADLDASSGDILIETLEVAHEGLKIES